MDELLNLPKETHKDWRNSQYLRPSPSPATPQGNEKLINALTAMGGLIGDWAQTRNLNKDGHYEQNPILGRHPNQESIDAYFAGSLLLHALSNSALSQESSDALNKALIITQGWVIGHNNRLPGNISSNF